jgi:preprotein translocase subunit SecG
MVSIITIIIILACVVLAFFVLIQNPKGGGLAGNFGSVSTQVMGVKQSTDVMEKGTWTSIGIIGVLCIVVVMFIDKPAGMERRPAPQKQSAPASAPANGAAPAAQPAAPAPAK